MQPEYALLIALPVLARPMAALVLAASGGPNLKQALAGCPSCRRPFAMARRLPLLSWIFWSRACPRCGASQKFFPAVEAAALVLALWIITMTSGEITILSGGLALWLLALSVFDLRSMILPNALTLPLIPTGLLVVVYLSPQSVYDHLIGAVLGWGVFLVIGGLFQFWKGRPGLGGGDAKLLAAAGAWLGWQAIPSVIAIAALSGLGLAGLQFLAGQRIARHTPIPFGPALALSFLGVWLHGPWIQP